MATQTAKVFKRGQLVRATALFRKNDGTDALVDPSEIRAIVKRPGGSPSIEYRAYPGSPTDVVKVSTGSYYSDLNLDVAGVWHVRWESEGTWQAAEEMSFNVKRGAFG